MTLSIFNIGATAFVTLVELIQYPMEEKLIPLIGALGSISWTYYLYNSYFDIYVAPVLD